MGRRAAFVAAVVAALAALLFPAQPAAAAEAGPDRDSTEAEFVDRINELRASKGLAPLAVDPALRDVARAWAARMASVGRISHRLDLRTVAPHPDWQKIGENVGVGATVESLHDAFVASRTHYINLVDPAWQHIGVGVVFAGGTIYVAENFMEIDETDAPAPVVAPLVRVAPPAPAAVSSKRPAAPVPRALACDDRGCPVARFSVARR